MFVIGLGQKHSIPTTVQLEIGNEVHALNNYFSSNYGDCLKNYLSKAGFIIDSHHGLVELFKSEALLDKAFSVVSSEAKIMTYCKANLGFVAPLQIEIQADYDKQIVNDRKNDKRNSLTNIAQIIAKISSQVKTNTSQTINSNGANQNKNQSSDLLCSYRDSNIFHKHVVFCKNKHALRIYMYIDEFKVCNPIGSHRSTHKLCAFYFFIDLNELCLNGIALTIDGESLQLYGALATISADNLSAHAIAGFRCAFNSGHICCYCMLRYEDKEKLLQETVLALRTETLHKYHLQGINAGISGRVYGFVKRCPLLDLSYFKLTESFPPDLMHDLHLGIIPLILKLLIINLHCDGIVTVSQLNYEIENFEFLKNDKKNKPIVIPLTVPSGTGNIVGSASEKFSLFYFLTFLIGDRVPINNKHWKLYLLLRDIVDYLMCYKISRTVLSYLQLLVESFVQTFVKLYPGKLTPKLHFLLHYPRLIADYGPLRYLWCMRFEAKHQYFKKLAGAVRNFKNIAYILAKRHQLHQCWEFEASSFLKEITESSGECSIYFNNLPECHRSKIIIFFEVSNFSDSEVLWKCNKLTIDSVNYKIYDVVLVGSLHGEDIPLFLKIMYIYKLKESWFFIGKVLICEQFSVHLHAYSVKEDIELSVCQPCNIIDPQLLNSYILADGKMYISLKYKSANIDGETLEGFTELMVGEVCKDDFRLRVQSFFVLSYLHIVYNYLLIIQFSLITSTSDFLVIPGVNNQNDARDVVVAVNNDRSSSFGNWPNRYPLPSFPRQVQDALNKEDKTIICAARTCLRTQLIQSLFEDITSKYTWYPNSMQYLEVISALCAKYSYLSDYSMPGCKKNGSPSVQQSDLKN
nr:uncharacterized protein LOC124808544 [Hydra vulgaris]